MALTGRDRKMAVRMLGGDVFAEGGEAEWRRELQVMVMLDAKAEIQLLDRRPGGLEGWLRGAIGKGMRGMEMGGFG